MKIFLALILVLGFYSQDAFPQAEFTKNLTTTTATQLSVTNDTSLFTVMAANATRRYFSIENDSSTTCYLIKASTGSSTNAWLTMVPAVATSKHFYESTLPIYKGAIKAICLSATGSLRTVQE